MGDFRLDHAPLALLAACFACGIIFVDRLPRASVFILIIAVLAAAVIWAFTARCRRPPASGAQGGGRALSPGVAAVLAAVAFIGGAFRMMGVEGELPWSAVPVSIGSPTPTGTIPIPAIDGDSLGPPDAGSPAPTGNGSGGARDDVMADGPVELAGVVCGVPSPTAHGWRFTLCPVGGASPVRVEWRGDWAGEPGPYPPASYGDAVMAAGRITRPSAPGNPWSFHTRRYWDARHLPAVLYASGEASVAMLDPPIADAAALAGKSSLRVMAARWPAARGLLKFREKARGALAEAMDGPEWELASALIFGDGGSVSDDVRGRFQRSGLAHLLAVSGLHIGLLVWIAERALQSVVYRRGARYAVLLLLLAAMVLWTGGRAPVVRVAAVFTIGGALMMTHRPPAPLHALGGAFLALLIYHPYQLWDIGFQLTFSAAGAIVLMGGPAADAVAALFKVGRGAGSLLASAPFSPGDGPPDGGPHRMRLAEEGPGAFGAPAIPAPRHMWVAVRSQLADAVGIGIPAFLGTAPVVAAVFGELQPLSIVTTPLALPVVTVFLVVGMGVVPPMALMPGAVPYLVPLLKAPGSLLYWLADVTSGFGPWFVPAAPWFLVVLYWVTLIYCLADGRPPVARRHRPRPPAYPRLLIAAAGVAAFFLWSFTLAAPRHLEVVFADVGQGDGIIVGAPPGLWMVIDGGGVSGGSGGGALATPGAMYGLSPFLARRGVTRPDLLVMSHGHADHGAGLAYILDERPGGAGAFIEPGFPGAGHWYQELITELHDKGVPRVVPRAGDRMPFGTGEIHFLGPPPEYFRGTGDDVNNSSLVFRLDYGGVRILFTGDAEEEAEGWLLVEYPGEILSSHVLKVAHHGSSTSSSMPFLEAVGAGVAVIQSGAGNPYGHPSPEALHRLAGSGALLFRNDKDGSVTIVSRGSRVCIRLGRAGGELCRTIEQVKR